MTNETLNRETIDDGEPIAGYRPICGLAIAGAIVGALSVTAYVNPLLWSVPLVGIVLNTLALRQLAVSRSLLLGRRAALVGLTCSLLFGSTALAHSLLEPVRVRGEARHFAQQWFAALREDEIYQAHQLTETHWRRFPADNLRWRYEQDPKKKGAAERYAGQEPARTLLALGKRAQIRLVRNERLRITRDERWVEDVYEVGVGEGEDEVGVNHDERRRPCLLQVELRGLPNLVTKQWGWEVKSAKWLDVSPIAWRETGVPP
ncbi:MAG TPA: hypothetical protein VMV69_10850 [Pirellulales bacterium]|nr:hypothetical protein [Pirellulales bacterium]